MPAVIMLAIVTLLMMIAPAGAEMSGKWSKGAPFSSSRLKSSSARLSGASSTCLAAWARDGSRKVWSMNTIQVRISGPRNRYHGAALAPCRDY